MSAVADGLPVEINDKGTKCPRDCTRECFYCEAPLSPRHEHDHWPTAKRHGGQSVVATCVNCHDLKDRAKVANWPNAMFVRAFAEAGPLGRILIARCADRMADMDAGERAALAERLNRPA